MRPLRALISKKTIHKAHVPDPNDCLKSDLMPFDIVTFSSYGNMVTAMYLTPRELTDYIGLPYSSTKLFPNGVFFTEEGDLVNVDYFDAYLKSNESEFSDIKIVLRYDEKVFGTIHDEKSILMILQSPLVERMIKKHI